MSQDQSTFYEEYEVFSRKKDGMPLEHRFSLLAPNAEMALILAKENFFRREPIADLWVVKRSNIRKMTQEERLAFGRLDKAYRETKGYADLVARWRAFKEKNGDQEVEIDDAGI
ncbi:1,2-phenylacetyl-CoA epoxidase subunit PaaB [Tuberibacillus calidus]|uniref:1,2-phenylacetyl-CoA epoxidase subunit PaaB n=1 Tax=Tuberibacillus calidus TaxID=340097 RepID=UPI0003FACAA7|nr:1,2-phenylacetyl-CoA epoxidase subunit PaaB [Tuberibacillus calidus]